MSKLMISPRGFVGAGIVTRDRQDSSAGLTNITSVFERLSGSDEQHPYNGVVQELYKEYNANTNVVLRMEFRERLLKAAMAAFGTHSFWIWYENQFRSPLVEASHLSFLDDTLNFIMCGQRQFHHNVWLRLLENDNVAREQLVVMAHGSVKATEKAIEYFGLTNNSYGPKCNSELIKTIQRWTSHDNGFDDLMRTLHLLFGQ